MGSTNDVLTKAARIIVVSMKPSLPLCLSVHGSLPLASI